MFPSAGEVCAYLHLRCNSTLQLKCDVGGGPALGGRLADDLVLV